MVAQHSEYSKKKTLLNGEFYNMLNYAIKKNGEKKSIKLSDLTLLF